MVLKINLLEAGGINTPDKPNFPTEKERQDTVIVKKE